MSSILLAVNMSDHLPEFYFRIFSFYFRKSISRVLRLREVFTDLGIRADFRDTFDDNETELLDKVAAEFKISEVNLINKETQDLEDGTAHLFLRSDKL